MKVLLVHNSYRSHLKGGEDAVFEQEYKELKKRLGTHAVFKYEVSNDDLKLWALPFTLLSNRKHSKKIRQLCIKERIDVVHVHNFFPMLTASVFVAAKKAGCKVVHTLHNYRWWCLNGTLFYNNKHCHRCVAKRLPTSGMLRGCYRNSRLQSLLGGIAFWWYKRPKVTKSIDRYFVLSQHQQKLLSQWLPQDKLRLKPNAIEIPSLKETLKKGYVFVGRLEPGKGIEQVLEVWQQLNQDYPLTIIGGGELEKNLKARYQCSHIQFLGGQPFEKVAKALASAKYCLHTSLYYETFGLVVLESMAQGTPVIGYPIGTREEFIQNEVNGFLGAPNTLLDLVKKAHHFDSYAKMSEQARKTAQKYNTDAIAAAHIQHYQELIDLP